MAITFSLGAAGTSVVEDDDILGNARARLLDPTGRAVQIIVYPEDSLSFIAHAAGVGLNLAFLDPLETASLTVGNLEDAAESMDEIGVGKAETDQLVILVANDTIREFGNDADADIAALGLLASAGAGVGTSSNAIETAVSFLKAETVTGGINIVNMGDVTVGGMSGGILNEITGLTVSTSGDIRLDAFGSITLQEESAATSITGGSTSGDVRLNALGSGAGITSVVQFRAITARGGSVVLNADGDISFGTAGTNFDNDIRARDSVTINAEGRFELDGSANVVSDDFGADGGGRLTVNAADGIFLLGNTGTKAGLWASGLAGADVVLTAGSGSTLSVQTPYAPPSIAPVSSVSGDVRASADSIEIGSTSGISATQGLVRLAPTTIGRSIDLGSATELGTALSLSDAEVDRIFAERLDVGTAQSGELKISADISPANASDLIVQSGTDIVVDEGVSVQTAGVLRLRAGEDIVLRADSTLQAADGVVGYVDYGDPNPGTGGRTIVDPMFGSDIKFIGNVDADRLFGGLGDDTLDGKGGDDRLTGRAGNDTYVVDSSDDKVVEAEAEGTDTVRSSISHGLGADVENLVLTGSADTNGIGNELDNELTGNAGANTLNGRAGADQMIGGAGNDTYVVDNAGDQAVETTGNGIDLVKAFISYSLSGQQVENLTLRGNEDIDGIGNALANTITGNGGNNVLDGDAGADMMEGLGGDDTYVVDDTDDKVIEANGEGTDTVRASISFSLGGQHGDNLTLLGSDDINGTGNSLANTIIGNDGNNVLNGAGGEDTLTGLGGFDIFRFSTALGAANVDVITDFDVATDIIELASGKFTAIPVTGTLEASRFVANATGTAENANHRIVYNTATGDLLYDADGNAAGSPVAFAQLNAGLAMTNVDFFVI